MDMVTVIADIYNFFRKSLIQGMKQGGFCSCTFCTNSGESGILTSVCYPYQESYKQVQTSKERSHKQHLTFVAMQRDSSSDISMFLTQTKLMLRLLECKKDLLFVNTSAILILFGTWTGILCMEYS